MKLYITVPVHPKNIYLVSDSSCYSARIIDAYENIYGIQYVSILLYIQIITKALRSCSTTIRSNSKARYSKNIHGSNTDRCRKLFTKHWRQNTLGNFNTFSQLLEFLQ